MLLSIGMIVTMTACFFAMLLNLAVDTRFRRALMRYAIVFAGCVGAVLYGYGYAYCKGFHLISLLQALMALCRMFGGGNDLGSVQDAPLFRNPLVIAVFWLAHFLAFYAMASAVIATLGERLLRQIRVTLLRRGPLLLIYGVNAHSVAYGRRIDGEKHWAVLCVDKDCDPALESSVNSFGGVVEKGKDALAANARFLRHINMKPGSRKLELAALHEDGRMNLEYARALLDAMTDLGIRPEQTSLLARGIGEEVAALQALGGRGYGNVYAFDDCDLTARLVIRDHPPCDLIRFDEKGKAAEDFHAVILGFGRMGRAMLRQLVMNGQFHGSRFRVDIFDPSPQNGFLHDRALAQHYDIHFHAVSGMADEFYAFLEAEGSRVRMIALCTGNREENREIADDLADWYPRGEAMPLVVHATRDGYFWLDENRREKPGAHFFDSDGFDFEGIDAMAMEVHHLYCENSGASRSALEDWRACSYFNRQSNRACADFFPAMLRAAGRTEAQVLAGDWPPAEDVLENLAITEHMRWCAFQYANGYSPMPEDVWNQRAERYRQERARGATPDFRIAKDEQRRLQACMIPWEDLDELSRRENAVTGGHVDYKQLDRNNVLLLSRAYRARRDSAED